MRSDEAILNPGDLSRRQFPENGKLRSRQPTSLFSNGRSQRLHVGDIALRSKPEGRTTLRDDSAKQAVGERGSHESRRIHRSCRLTEERDISRIATELRYILLHPLESCNLIQKPIVAGAVMGRLGSQLRMERKPIAPRR